MTIVLKRFSTPNIQFVQGAPSRRGKRSMRIESTRLSEIILTRRHREKISNWFAQSSYSRPKNREIFRKTRNSFVSQAKHFYFFERSKTIEPRCEIWFSIVRGNSRERRVFLFPPRKEKKGNGVRDRREKWSWLIVPWRIINGGGDW